MRNVGEIGFFFTWARGKLTLFGLIFFSSVTIKHRENATKQISDGGRCNGGD